MHWECKAAEAISIATAFNYVMGLHHIRTALSDASLVLRLLLQDYAWMDNGRCPL
jgi:hypothetical protein